MLKTIHSPEYNSLLKWLREQRKEKAITMRDLAKKIDVHHSWIGKIEQGERRLDIVEYLRICNALGIDPHEGVDLVKKNLS